MLGDDFFLFFGGGGFGGLVRLKGEEGRWEGRGGRERSE